MDNDFNIGVNDRRLSKLFSRFGLATTSISLVCCASVISTSFLSSSINGYIKSSENTLKEMESQQEKNSINIKLLLALFEKNNKEDEDFRKLTILSFSKLEILLKEQTGEIKDLIKELRTEFIKKIRKVLTELEKFKNLVFKMKLDFFRMISKLENKINTLKEDQLKSFNIALEKFEKKFEEKFGTYDQVIEKDQEYLELLTQYLDPIIRFFNDEIEAEEAVQKLKEIEATRLE